MHYTLPSMIDGLTVSASYHQQRCKTELILHYALVYTGVEGLSLSYGEGSRWWWHAGTTSLKVITQSMKASYAYGPVTVAYSDHDHDSNTGTSWPRRYILSNCLTLYLMHISLSYGEEEMIKATAASRCRVL